SGSNVAKKVDPAYPYYFEKIYTAVVTANAALPKMRKIIAIILEWFKQMIIKESALRRKSFLNSTICQQQTCTARIFKGERE
uniref:Uncharacterized protein n=1 Tax=Romanomermis culicivorax TaxID=13658 RepID=A0A915JAZ1_ROMCU